MQSRRDQVQAHAFLAGRLNSALVTGEPDAAEAPMRRTTIGWLAGLATCLLLLGGFAVIGLVLGGGDKSWRTAPRALIVEKDSGTRYLWLDGQLRPVHNYASARLLLNGAPTLRTVSAKSLAGVGHGLPVGTVGAPDALPTVKRLNLGGWYGCAGTAPDASGTAQPVVALVLGPGPGTALPEDRAAVVRAGGEAYAVWQGRRHRLARPWVAGALGLDAAAPLTVDPRWLNLLPAGPDLLPPTVSDRGAPGPTVGGRPTRAGQVLRVTGDDRDAHYVVTGAGLAPVTATQAALLLADPATAAAYPDAPVTAVPTTAAAVSGLPPLTLTAAALPARPPGPTVPTAGQWLCASWVDGQPGLRIVTGPPGARLVAPSDGVRVGPGAAEAVGVAAGTGWLVRPAVGATGGDVTHLVTDAGVRYPLGAGAAKALGYDPASAELVPPAYLELLPTGPLLSTTNR